MTGDVFFLVFGNFVVVKTRKVIEILVVKPHVLDTEVQILAFAIASHGRFVTAGLGAALPRALIGRALLFFLLLRAARFDSNLVENVGIGCHGTFDITRRLQAYATHRYRDESCRTMRF